MNTNKQEDKMNLSQPEKQENGRGKVETQLKFTPRRFSVRGLRKHTGIKTSRTPRVAY